MTDGIVVTIYVIGVILFTVIYDVIQIKKYVEDEVTGEKVHEKELEKIRQRRKDGDMSQLMQDQIDIIENRLALLNIPCIELKDYLQKCRELNNKINQMEEFIRKNLDEERDFYLEKCYQMRINALKTIIKKTGSIVDEYTTGKKPLKYKRNKYIDIRQRFKEITTAFDKYQQLHNSTVSAP